MCLTGCISINGEIISKLVIKCAQMQIVYALGGGEEKEDDLIEMLTCYPGHFSRGHHLHSIPRFYELGGGSVAVPSVLGVLDGWCPAVACRGYAQLQPTHTGTKPLQGLHCSRAQTHPSAHQELLGSWTRMICMHMPYGSCR